MPFHQLPVLLIDGKPLAQTKAILRRLQFGSTQAATGIWEGSPASKAGLRVLRRLFECS